MGRTLSDVTENELLKAIAEEIKSDRPQEGEYTREMFRAYLKSQEIDLNNDETDGWLNRLVREGKMTFRKGHSDDGRPCRIYKPK